MGAWLGTPSTQASTAPSAQPREARCPTGNGRLISRACTRRQVTPSPNLARDETTSPYAKERPCEAGVVRGVLDRRRADARPATSAGLVLAEVAPNLPLRLGPALRDEAPNPDQPGQLAGRGSVVSDQQVRTILAVHVRGVDGMCAGCRAWWSRLAPYPCYQVDWATARAAWSITARFLGGLR